MSIDTCKLEDERARRIAARDAFYMANAAEVAEKANGMVVQEPEEDRGQAQ